MPFRFHGHFGWPGYFGWDSFYLGLPLWWDPYWGWGSPYGYYGYYGDPDPGIAWMTGEPGAASPSYPSGSGATVSPDVSLSASDTVAGPSPVDVEASPADALVYLNGVLVGSAGEFAGRPDYLYLEPGQYNIDLRLPGHRSKSLKLDVRGESKVVLSIDLRVDPAAGAAPASPPSPGLPYGRRFGPTFGPGASPTSPQTGDGRVVQPAASGESSTALLLRVSPPGAAVYVDGVLLGSGDALARRQQGVAVSPGPHRIDVVAPGHAAKTMQVNAEAGRSQEVSITLD